jgi:putative transposase
MPDHLHALVEGRASAANLRHFLIAFRRRTTVATKFMAPGGLWQDGYFERVLREDDEPYAAIDYILNNPVRAGLVTRAVDYPYSWSCTLEDNPRP